MKDFKSIDELNIFECYEIVKEKTHPFFDQVKNRLDQELKKLCIEEKRDFEACRSTADYERFLKKYRPYAAFYSMQYKKKAEDALDKLYWHSKRATLDGCKSYLSCFPNGIYRQEASQAIDSFKHKKFWARFISVLVLLTALIIVFFIGYEPVDYISLSESSLSFSKYGETKYVKISTNASIYDCGAESSDYWITISMSEYKVTLTAKPNPNSERGGHVTFYAYSTLYGNNLFRKEITISVKQDSGKPSYLTVSKNNFQFNKMGTVVENFYVKTDGVNIKTICSYEWLNIDHDDIVGSSTKFRISTDINNDGWRYANVKIIVGDFEETITISQESGRASYFELDKQSINIGEEGTPEGYCRRFHVSTDGASWSANTNNSWISLTQYGNTLDIEISPNDADVRSGNVYVKSNNDHIETITVKQDGNPTEFYSSEESYTFDTDGGYKYISFTCNSDKSISVSANKTWLSSRIVDSQVQIACQENNNSPRDAIVTLKCGNKETKISIRQRGWKICSACGGIGSYTQSVYEDIGGIWMYGIYMPNNQWVRHTYHCPTCKNSGKSGYIKSN